MPTFYPATDPLSLPAGPTGPVSRDEYVALIQGGALCRPKIFGVTPGRVNSAAPVVHTFLGESLIPPGWVQALLSVEEVGVPNTEIEWIAVQPGEGGNAIQVEYIAGAGALAIAMVGNVVTVTLAAGGSTSAFIIAALPGSGAEYFVMARNAHGSTGAGVNTSASGPTNLAGGTGLAFRQAELVIDPAGANNALRYRARRVGVGGEAITIEYTIGAPGGGLPVVTVVGNAIAIQLDAGVSTANDVLRSLESSAAARALISAELVYGETGAGTLPGAVAAAPLAGGADGTGVSMRVGGLAGQISAIADGTITGDVAAVAGLALNDMALVELNVCGYYFSAWLPVI